MSKCIICGTELGDKPLFELHNAPANAQDLSDYESLNNDQGISLDLYQCTCCGLIQLDCEPVNYFRDVIRGGGWSDTLQSLRRKQYRYLIDSYHLEGKKFIEIGCGEGEFIVPLTEFSVQVFGIENREGLVKKAISRGLKVWRAFPETPDNIIDNGPFDVFLMFNFLEHQPKPNDMLQCIRNNLTEDGIGLLTVPSFDYVFRKSAFYELMRDHIAYYTEDSLRFLMNRNGFDIMQLETLNENTISAVVRKRKKVSLDNFFENQMLLTKKLMDFASKKITEGKTIALWGASHEAFMILSVTGFGKFVDYIIDSATYKQGKYAPASHVPIVAPEHWFDAKADCIVIIAPEYALEISKIIRNRFGRDVEVFSILGSDICTT